MEFVHEVLAHQVTPSLLVEWVAKYGHKHSLTNCKQVIKDRFVALHKLDDVLNASWERVSRVCDDTSLDCHDLLTASAFLVHLGGFYSHL